MIRDTLGEIRKVWCIALLIGCFVVIAAVSYLGLVSKTAYRASDIPVKAKPYEIRQKDFVAGVYQYEEISSPHKLFLNQTPEGMQLISNERYSRLSWVPEADAAGKNYEVILDVEDGTGETQSRFTVKVADSRPIKGRRLQSLSALLVDDEACGLSSFKDEYFQLSFSSSDYVDVKELDIAIVTSDVNYHVPSHIKRHSCFFKIGKADQQGMGDYSFNVKLAASLKQTLFKRNEGQLKLYNLMDWSTVLDSGHSYDSSVWSTEEYQQASGLFFIGVDTTEQ
jgi:hypothetical protein